MDEMNNQATPVDDETAEVRSEEVTPDEGAAAEPKRRSRGRKRFFGGVISGVIVGHFLGLMLARLRGEERARRGMVESGTWESREGPEEEGRLPAKVAVERAQAIAVGVTSRIVAAWATLRERLRDAVEEGKEGIAEGQEEARTRYEIMTRRRRRR
jgi:gas vesicle protein